MIDSLTARDFSKTVGTSSTLIIAPNSYREWVAIVNQGANNVWLRLGAAAEADKGIFLINGGGNAVFDKREMPWYGEIYGIADSVASKITCQEVEVLH